MYGNNKIIIELMQNPLVPEVNNLVNSTNIVQKFIKRIDFIYDLNLKIKCLINIVNYKIGKILFQQNYEKMKN